MRVMVLGGGGFIGSHLVRRLVDQGEDVWAVDVQFPEYRDYQWLGAASKWTADLRQTDQAVQTIRNVRPDVIYQLAADMGGVEYFHSEHDWQAAVNNQMINVNVMSAVSKYVDKARVIFTSTACALAVEKQTHYNRACFTPGTWEYNYGEEIVGGDQWELTEKDILWGTPDQLYGQEKRNSAFLWQRAPFDTRVAFLHTVYGPYQEFSGIRMKFPSAVAQKARKARETGRIELLGDGRQVRTYLYVDDAVDRILDLAGSETDPGFVNIGGVVPYTVDEVAMIARDVADPYRDGHVQAELIHVPGPTGVEARAADMTKFNDHFPGYNKFKNPDVTLAQGMKRFIDWLDEVDK